MREELKNNSVFFADLNNDKSFKRCHTVPSERMQVSLSFISPENGSIGSESLGSYFVGIFGFLS